MNARIAKEIRLLLPLSVGGAVFLVLMAWILGIFGNDRGAFALPFLICCAILGIASFGRDVMGNTLSQMFSQPVPRAVLWREKVVVSGIILLSIIVLFHTIVFPDFRNSNEGYFGNGFFMVGIILPLFAFTVGPLLVLVTRQVNASFWLLILFGLALAFVVMQMSDWLRMNRFLMIETSVAFGVVSLVSFSLARKKFLQYEDNSSLAREISIPLNQFFPWSKNKAGARTLPSKPTWNLIKKELQLQQINFVFVLGFYLVMFVGLVFLTSGTISAEGREAYVNDLKELVAVGIRLVGVCVPFIIGAVAFAEERRYGVEEWHLLLPVSRFKQWCIKLFTCFVLATVLGSGFVFVIDGLAYFFSDSALLEPFGQAWKGIDSTEAMMLVAYYALFPVAAICSGLLASSLARNFLQALSIQMAIIVVFPLISLLALSFIYRESVQMIRSSGLLYPSLYHFISLPVILGLSLWLSFRNFSYLEPFRKQLTRTCLVLFLGWFLTVSVTAITYNRVWDFSSWASPADPEFGQAGELKPSISFNGAVGAAIGSDGTLWTWGWDVTQAEEIDQITSQQEQMNFGMKSYSQTPVQVGMDSDWKQVLARQKGFLALKNDGTLWAIGGFRFNNHLSLSRLGIGEPTDQLVQVEEESSWSALAGAYAQTLGIKTDGTLWIWGGNENGALGMEDENAEYTSPTQVGNQTDWIDVAACNYLNFALKSDGSIWLWGSKHRTQFGLVRLENHTSLPELFYNEKEIQDIQMDDDYHLIARSRGGAILYWQYAINGGRPYELNSDIVRDDLADFPFYYSIDSTGTSVFPSIAPEGHWADYDGAYYGKAGFDNYAITYDGTLWHWQQPEALGSNGSYPLGLEGRNTRPRTIAKLSANP